MHTGVVTDARAAVPDTQPAPPGTPVGGNPDHPAAHSSGLSGLVLGALGIVFGDIGTSPLYAVQTVFSIDDGAVKPTIADVYGVVIPRVPGTAVFPHPTKLTAPLALRANVEFNHVRHERVVIVSIVSENVPHVPLGDRLAIDDLGEDDAGILHLSARFGFQDEQDIPHVLRQACALSDELDIDPDTALYFLSRMTIERGPAPSMSGWRKPMFIGLSHNAATPAAYFQLPVDRTVIMGSRIEL